MLVRKNPGCTTKVGASEVGALIANTAKACSGESGSVEFCAREVHTTEIGPIEIDQCESTTCQVGIDQIGVAEVSYWNVVTVTVEVVCKVSSSKHIRQVRASQVGV